MVAVTAVGFNCAVKISSCFPQIMLLFLFCTLPLVFYIILYAGVGFDWIRAG